uniref:Uncharacterized protein n=1 Tax=Anguilla anguilla TaxID=7936 RepID=A0A0E9RKR5_ANGAN
MNVETLLISLRVHHRSYWVDSSILTLSLLENVIVIITLVPDCCLPLALCGNAGFIVEVLISGP